MKWLCALAALLAASAATPALAGPPYLTDDPEPTETGHWEIYAPLFQSAGRGPDFAGWFEAEINYGPAQDVQLTLDLPAAFAHDSECKSNIIGRAVSGGTRAWRRSR